MSALVDIVKGDTPIDNNMYEQYIKDYPYFLLPHLLRLQRSQNQLSSQERDTLVAKLAMMLPERDILFNITNTESALLDSFYPAQQDGEELNTDSTIDSFLKNFGRTSEREEELITQQIFNPTPEYATLLAAEYDEKSATENIDLSENDQRINDFIQNRKTTVEPEPTEIDPQSQEPVVEPEEHDDSMLSESLAKIYIKQGKYTKALEIITKISLINSEKSVYFADQIRFLKKLIINERFKA